MIRFQLAGRLGNQLFQWAAALCMNNQHESLRLIYDEYHQSAPTSLLRDVLDGQFQVKKNNIVGRILQLEDRYSLRKPGLTRIIYTDANPYSEVLEIPEGTKIVRGYFQNWKNISKNEKYISETLDRAILNTSMSSIRLIEIREHLGEFEAVHVRQGDYQSSGFDVLSPDYYKAQRIRRHLPLVVFTDSYDLDERYMNAIKPDLVISPNELGAEETLALMSMSQRLVLANSTFSWWAGFLVSQKGNPVVIPNHWQRKDETRGSLLHPKFQIANSIFE